MDATQATALAAAIAALPVNAFLILIIVLLWRRLNAVTDRLIEVKAAKTDDPNKLQDAPRTATLPE